MALDITEFELLWGDEFTELKLADSAPRGDANWYTRQMWGGGFGNAAFQNANSGVFSIVEKGGETSVLEIRMRRNGAGGLESGIISNVFPDGTSAAGQTTREGYYEARLWLPDPEQGIWPAFWGIETERLLTIGRDHVLELDVLEHYGAPMADRYTTVIHDWDWNGTTFQGEAGKIWTRKVPGHNVMNAGWHTYGIEISADGSMTFYFDREPYFLVGGSTSNLYTGNYNQLMNHPFGWMINLAAGGGWPINPDLGTEALPCALWVDYFRIYVRPTPQPEFSTDFTGTAGDDISVIPGIMRTDGAAGGLTISSLGSCNANTTAMSGIGYALPSTGMFAQYISASIKNVASWQSGPALCVRYTDEANWIGVRWGNTTVEMVKKVAGTISVIASASSLTLVMEDVIRLEIDSDHNARVLLNGTEIIGPTPINAPTLNSKCTGLVPRYKLKQPWIDNLVSGPLV